MLLPRPWASLRRPSASELARLVKITQALAPELGDYPELVEFAERLGRMLADPAGLEVVPASPATSRGRAAGATVVQGVALPTIRRPEPTASPPVSGRSATKVYVSSTYSDLKEYRQKVYEVLRQMGFDVIAMEDFIATDQRPLQQCLADVAACDVYIGIIAWRYGYVPEKDNPEGRSVTELEYRQAVRLGKPCLIFLLDEQALWPSMYFDRISGKVEKLRTELKRERLVQFFQTPDQLAALVASSMNRYSSISSTSDATSAAEQPVEGHGKVQHRTCDIFVSYAHVDDVPFPGESQGWVSTLVKYLQHLTAQRLGRSELVNIFMYRSLAGNEPITSELVDLVRGSAIFLIVLSPGYLASEWSRREMNLFLDEIRRRRAIGQSIFVVELDKVKRPPELAEFRGYQFWVEDRMSGRTRTLGIPRPNPEDHRYFERLVDLSHDLVHELERQKAAPQGAASTPPTPADESPAVYLAEVTDDLEVRRDDVRRYLNQAGLRVLPQTLYARDVNGYRMAAEADLRRAILFVQLLSGIRGRKLEGSTTSFVAFQHELAKNLGLPVLQWRPRDLDPVHVKNSEHRWLMESPTVIVCDISEFKAIIIERVRELSRPMPIRSSEARAKTGKLVFVNAARVDLDLAREVGEALIKLGAWVALPVAHGAVRGPQISRQGTQ